MYLCIKHLQKSHLFSIIETWLLLVIFLMQYIDYQLLSLCAFLFIMPSFSIHRVRYTNNNESENSYDVDVGNTKLMRKCYVEAK